LVGGGDLSTNRTFNIGQGDGITVSADAIAVDSSVVRTTGVQTINGSLNLSDFGVNYNNYQFIMGSPQTVTINSNGNDANFYSAQWAGAVISLGVADASDSQALSNVLVLTPHGLVFPDSSVQSTAWLGSTTASQITDFNNGVSGVLSSITFTAGSGLAGGGTLSSSRTFNVGQGDGIAVSADSIAVDSTVVRTTGTQSVGGVKTFGNTAVFGSGITSSGTNTLQVASTASTATQFAVFTSSPSATAQAIYTRSPSEVKTDIGLSNLTNNTQVKQTTGGTTVGYVPTWNSTSGELLAAGYSIETTLAGSSSSLPRADAVKTYVDNAIVSGIATNDAMVFKGAIDCSTNPNYPAADRGWTYKVSVAGKIGGASGTTVEVNDTLICTTDSTSAGTQAAVGSNWVILQTNITDATILVTGPTSATSGNFALFDGTTGKIIKDAGYAASTIASNSTVVLRDTNGSFTTYSITCNNTLTSLSGILSYGTLGFKAAAAGSAATYFPVFTTDPTSVAGNMSSRTAAQVKGDIGLGNVENTALSTWAGSTNITTLGTVSAGTWSATTIAANKGGTGQSSYAVGDLLYADTSSTLAKLTDVATGNALLAGGVNTAPSWGKIGLTAHVSGTLPVANGGTNQTSFTDGQLLIGNSTGNTLTKATLTAGTAVDITNGGGSITIGHNDTSTLTGAQGSNGIASFTVDGMGHVTAVTTATYLTAATVCASIVDCLLDGGTF
jgi:hypothetical protein